MPERADWPRAWLLPAIGGLALVFAIASSTDMFDAHFYLTAMTDGWSTAWPYPPLALIPAATTLADANDPNRALVILATVPATVATLAMLWLVKGRYRVLPVLFTTAAFATLAWSYANRLEPLSVSLAVGGLIALRVGRQGIGGLLLGLGGLVKAWPLLLVLGAATWARWRTVASAVVTIAVVGGAATLIGGSSAWGWLGFASTRGLEMESIAALPGLWARALGSDSYRVALDPVSASAVINGPGLVATKWLWGATILTVVLVVTFHSRHHLALREWSSAHARHVLVLIVGAMLCLPVLSPQYMCWPIAVIGVALIDGWLRRTAVAWLVACALTTTIFPVLFVPLAYEGALAPLIVLTARDILILGVFASSVATLWRQAKTAA